MKKLILALALSMIGFTFISCEKEEIETEKSNSYSITYVCSKCGETVKLDIFYYGELTPSYTCRTCGHGGTFKKVRQ